MTAAEQGAAPDRLQPALWSFLPSLRLPAAAEFGRCAAARGLVEIVNVQAKCEGLVANNLEFSSYSHLSQ